MAAILPVSLSPIAADAVDAGRVGDKRTAPAQAASKVPPPKSAEAFRQFESFVLQSFIETMLPKSAESVFGKGTAGGIWKSMLAEKLADQISRSGGIGIASRIAAGPGVAMPPANVSLQSTQDPRGDDA